MKGVQNGDNDEILAHQPIQLFNFNGITPLYYASRTKIKIKHTFKSKGKERKLTKYVAPLNRTQRTVRIVYLN